MSATLSAIRVASNGNGNADVTITRDDGTTAIVKCKASDLQSYTRLQSALLTKGGIFWRDYQLEDAHPRRRRREFLDLIEQAIATAKATA